MEIAKKVQLGANFLRAQSHKGPHLLLQVSVTRGIKMLLEEKEGETGLPIVTEIMDITASTLK